MRKNKQNLLMLAITVLMIIGYSAESLAFPIPTIDIKRIGSTMKTVKHQVDIVKREVEFNMNLVKQIQNGGYAAAGMALVGHMDVYANYGKMGKELGYTLHDSATNTQAAFAGKEKRAQLEQKLAARQAKREAKERETAERKAAERMDKQHKAYKREVFVKKFKQWAPIAVRAGQSAEYMVNNGDFSLDGVVSTVEGSGIIKVGEDVAKNVKNDKRSKKEAEDAEKDKDAKEQGQGQGQGGQ